MAIAIGSLVRIVDQDGDVDQNVLVHDPIDAIALSDEQLLVACPGGNIVCYDRRTRTKSMTRLPVKGRVVAVDVSKHNTAVVAYDEDDVWVRFGYWRSVLGFGGTVRDVQVTHQRVYVATSEGVWVDERGRQNVELFKNTPARKFMWGDESFGLQHEDGTLELVHTSLGATRASILTNQARLSKDGRVLVVGGRDGRVLTVDGELLPAFERPVADLSLSHDGRVLVATDGLVVSIWKNG